MQYMWHMYFIRVLTSLLIHFALSTIFRLLLVIVNCTMRGRSGSVKVVASSSDHVHSLPTLDRARAFISIQFFGLFQQRLWMDVDLSVKSRQFQFPGRQTYLDRSQDGFPWIDLAVKVGDLSVKSRQFSSMGVYIWKDRIMVFLAGIGMDGRVGLNLSNHLTLNVRLNSCHFLPRHPTPHNVP